MKQYLNEIPESARIKSAEDLGKFVRTWRKARGITLETVSGLSNVSTKFLSEFERGKDTAEVGKILKVLNVLGLEVTIEKRNTRIQQAHGTKRI